MSPAGLLRSAILQRQARHVILKDEKAFEALLARLQGALTRAYDAGLRRGLIDALDALHGLDPGLFTTADAQDILEALRARVGPEALTAALQGPVMDMTDALYRLGMVEVGVAAGIDIAFGRPDRHAMAILGQGNLYWVGNSWNTYTLNTIQSILGDYFREGMTREQLTSRFAHDFSGMADKSRRYWELLADHTATKTREMGRVSGYEQAGLEYVQVRAHLDARTTEICRHMHGRIIAVTALRKQVDAYLVAARNRDAEAMKRAWTMHSDAGPFAAMRTTNLPPGTAGPPYHFRCRSITVAWFEPDSPAQLEVGPSVSASTSQRISAYTPEEHRAWVLDAKTSADTLNYSAKDFDSDVRKAKARTLKHAAKDFGLTDPNDYLAKARAIVRDAERVFANVYKGELQYSFISLNHKGYVVLDKAFEIRGCFGHPQPGAINRCLKEKFLNYQTEITY